MKLDKVKSMVSSLWADTEMEIDTLSRKELKDLIRGLGNKVNNITEYLEDQFKLCSHCEGDTISVCEPCLDTMAVKYGDT
jgi:hypothetical protein